MFLKAKCELPLMNKYDHINITWALRLFIKKTLENNVTNDALKNT